MIEPQVVRIRPDEIARRDELIELGEKAAEEMLPRINELLAKCGGGEQR
ncbi:MAG: hypothetical protein IPM25_07485 [Chloracidobacterium sp.]|nr:hypothetical protein [Chloracidobacterium sp.]